MAKVDKLSFDQARRRFEKLEDFVSHAKVRKGWIYYLRNLLGMSQAKLAERIGGRQEAIAQAERQEQSGKISLSNLEKLANAMNCELVYAFMPKEDPESFLRNQARKKAVQIINQASTHMELEDQEVRVEKEKRVENLVEDLINKGKAW